MMGECPVLAGMSMMMTLMPSMSDNSQRRDTYNGKLAEHLVQHGGRCSREDVYQRHGPLAIVLMLQIVVLSLELFLKRVSEVFLS